MRKISSRMIVKRASKLEAAMKALKAAEEAVLEATRGTERAIAGTEALKARETLKEAEAAKEAAELAVKTEKEAAKSVAESMRAANEAAPVVPDAVKSTDAVTTVAPSTILDDSAGVMADSAGQEANKALIGKANNAKEKTTSIASKVGKWYSGITGPQKVILVGAILGETIYQLTPDQAAERIDAELSSYEQILAPIYENDLTKWYGGNLRDITQADRDIILRKVTKAVLTNDTATLSPEGIAGLIENSNSAKNDLGHFRTNMDWVMNNQSSNIQLSTMKQHAGTWSAIQNASEILTEKATKIAESAAAVAAAEAARPAPTPAPVAPTTAPTEPPPISSRPAETGASRRPAQSGISDASDILVNLGYLSTPQTSWTPDFDKAFRSFIDAATSKSKELYHTSLSSGKESWAEVAEKIKFDPNVSGAVNAVKRLSSELGTAAGTAATTAGTDTLPSIVSAMYTGNLTKLLGPDFTRGIDLVNEERRMRILVGALGGASKEGYENASKVILQQDPGLSADLPKIIDGAITKDYVKQNMDLFRRIQTALNKITSGAFGPLAPANMSNAISKMRAWLQTKEGGGWTIQSVTSSQNSQWVKLANERKMKLRSQIAAEMTPAERAAARRIKMREAV